MARTSSPPSTLHRAILGVLLGAVIIAGGALAYVELALDDAGAETSTAAPTTQDPSSVDTRESSTLTAAETTTTTAPSTTTSEAPTTTTTTEPPPPPAPKFTRGDNGPEVADIQHKLNDLGYWLPEVDGTYGFLTSQAVMAFQKYEGLGRDGVAGPKTLGALETAGHTGPRNPSGTRVEIDLERQLMFVVHSGATLTFNTSTGTSGWRTPPGEFKITRQIDGLRISKLGELWRPKYFNGGIAMHGSPSIPGYAASHGCARLSNAAIDFIWAFDLVPVGTPVSVY